MEGVKGGSEVWALSVTDLRRVQARASVDAVLARAAALPPPERALLEAYFRDGRSLVELGRFYGVSHRKIRVRVRRVIERVSAPEFGYVASRLGELGPTRRRVAQVCVIEGLSMSCAQRVLGMSYYRIRRHMDAIRAASGALRAAALRHDAAREGAA